MNIITQACREGNKKLWQKIETDVTLHPRWKGDQAGYRAKHQRIVKLFGKADMCENMNCQYPNYHRFEWACLDNNYDTDRSHWAKLCVYCHRRMDKKGILPVLND